MLGLGSSVNSEEAYAKGERYRERFHTGGSYHPATNPIGRLGEEVDYIGDFASAGDGDNFADVNAGSSLSSGTLRIRSTGSNGHSSIGISVVPNTNYTLTYLNDPADSANSGHALHIGTTVNAYDIARLVVSISDDNTTQSQAFDSGDNNYLYVSWEITTNGRFAFIDNISFKES